MRITPTNFASRMTARDKFDGSSEKIRKKTVKYRMVPYRTTYHCALKSPLQYEYYGKWMGESDRIKIFIGVVRTSTNLYEGIF